MNEHTERNPMAIQEEMNKFIEEKPMSERMKEPGKNGFLLDDQINEIDVTKRQK
jgi:hypothetical protein